MLTINRWILLMLAGLPLPRSIAPATEIALVTSEERPKKNDLESTQTKLQDKLNTLNDEISRLQRSRDEKEDKIIEAEMNFETDEGIIKEGKALENSIDLEAEIEEEDKKIAQLEKEKTATTEELKNTIQKIQETKKLPALTPEELTNTIEDLEKAHKTEKEQLEKTLKDEKDRQLVQLEKRKADRKAKQTGDKPLLSLRALVKQTTQQSQTTDAPDTKQEVKRIIDQGSKELNTLKAAQDAEKNRQKQALQAKLADRKKTRDTPSQSKTLIASPAKQRWEMLKTTYSTAKSGPKTSRSSQTVPGQPKLKRAKTTSKKR